MRLISILTLRAALWAEKLIAAYFRRKFGVEFDFIPQGWGSVYIDGEIGNFKIHPTSQLKSGAYIECKGNVEIGRHFHTGRGLVVMSSNHEYKEGMDLPYGNNYERYRTVVKDYVWCGANVTILPGAVLEEGCIVSAGSVVRGHFPKGSIVAGNPAKTVSSRNAVQFKEQLEHARKSE
jgi:acetyltransferase-like isoleucine patch superfamily enzyme